MEDRMPAGRRSTRRSCGYVAWRASNRQREDAEELTLDTFAAVASLKNVYRGESGFGTWLFAIAKRQAYQALRKRRPLLLPQRHKHIKEREEKKEA